MIDLETYLHYQGCDTYEETGKILRLQFSDNYKRFQSRFLAPLRQWLTMNDAENVDDVVELYEKLWRISKPYTYKEAFEIENNTLRSLVFSHIPVSDMVKELGSTRIQTEGIELVNRVYVPETQSFKDEPLTQIYELHEVNGEKLGLSEPLYAIRCWCTSTSTEHWLFIEDKQDVLEAIASTCHYYEEMIGKIKSIIRQGDVFLFEMTEPVNIKENSVSLPMNKETYFKLLKSQS
jgi:hypothetical protein